MSQSDLTVWVTYAILAMFSFISDVLKSYLTFYNAYIILMHYFALKVFLSPRDAEVKKDQREIAALLHSDLLSVMILFIAPNKKKREGR